MILSTLLLAGLCICKKQMASYDLVVTPHLVPQNLNRNRRVPARSNKAPKGESILGFFAS